jgi:hypothetical protein
VYVVCVLKPFVLRSSENFNTYLLIGTGVLLRRLQFKVNFAQLREVFGESDRPKKEHLDRSGGRC